ncbi:MAG: DNA cytosine methyltransferase [Deltaproteobacteria bacterium]|jgi:DNA (cytosine-5)-methyltransferase 1|nr:DNA cytosine methyltransferase [Deltaproteobacteria bacterium]
MQGVSPVGLRAISLFSGAGGMDLGIRRAGFDVLAAIESDRHCCATLRAAIGREGAGTRVYQADIREIDPARLGEELAIAPAELDLLFGGPPCQPFSFAGKKNGLGDERGPLLFEMIRFAGHFLPRIILVEQVKGLLSARDPGGVKGGVLDGFLRGLGRIGYASKWRLCSAADYGVPQLRERLFIVAARGENRFEFPAPTHGPPPAGTLDLSGLPPYVTAGEALAGLGEPAPAARGAGGGDGDDSHVDVTPPRDRERISRVPEGQCLAAQTHLPTDLRCGLQSRDSTKYLRLHRGRPSNTLRCGEIFFHPVEDRYLTPRECMRIHGFGDDYRLCGPVRARTGTAKSLDRHRQVANSVPPPLARALGEGIRECLAGCRRGPLASRSPA